MPVVSNRATVGTQSRLRRVSGTELALQRRLTARVSSQQLSSSTAYIPIESDTFVFAQLPGSFSQPSSGSGFPGQFEGRRSRGNPGEERGRAWPTIVPSANSRQKGLPLSWT